MAERFNISIMQLFHELKQKFPEVPDRLVSECIRQNYHNRQKCEEILSQESRCYTYSYPAAQIAKMYASVNDSRTNVSSRMEELSICNNPSASGNQINPPTYGFSYPTSTSSEIQDFNQNTMSASSTTYNQCSVIGRHVSGSESARHCVRSDVYSQFESGMPRGYAGASGAVPNFPSDPPNSNVFSYGGDISGLSGMIGPQFFQVPGRRVSDIGVPMHGPSIRVQEPQSAPVMSTTFESFPLSAYNHPGGYMFNGAPGFSSSGIRGSHHPGGMPGPHRLHFPQYQTPGDASYDPQSASYVPRPACQVNVNMISNSEQAPPNRHMTSLTVHPAAHYMGNQGFRPEDQNLDPNTVRCPRPFTSVNLMLRPPSSEPQPPIDIHSAGSSLTYSTSSYNPKEGYQSQLQIQIGSGGGTISALRTRVPTPSVLSRTQVPCQGTKQVSQRPRSFYQPPPPPDHPPPRTASLPDVPSSLLDADDSLQCSVPIESQRSPSRSPSPLEEEEKLLIEKHTHEEGEVACSKDLLLQQMERKNKLEKELKREKEKLRSMQVDIQNMQKDLEERQNRQRISTKLPVNSEKKVTPKALITAAVSAIFPAIKGNVSNFANSFPQLLHIEKVQKLKEEISILQEKCKKLTTAVDIHSGCQIPLGETNEEFYENIYTGQSGLVLTSEPAPMRPPQSSQLPRQGVQEPNEGPNWNCSTCTFRNHPALDKCEQCEMPRILLGTDSAQQANSKPCYCHRDKTLYTSLPIPEFPVMVAEPENPSVNLRSYLTSNGSDTL